MSGKWAPQVIYNNGTIGGAAINLDGVQDSIVRNNVLYNNHATGIVNYRGDGAAGPQGTQILHNTVDVASDGRYALLLHGSTGTNVVRNNILYNRHSFPGDYHLSNGPLRRRCRSNAFGGDEGPGRAAPSLGAEFRCRRLREGNDARRSLDR